MTKEAKRYAQLHRDWMAKRRKGTAEDIDAHLELMDEAWEALTDEERAFFNGEAKREAESLRGSMPELVDVPATEGFPRRIK
jgi:hypothetical protein